MMAVIFSKVAALFQHDKSTNKSQSQAEQEFSNLKERLKGKLPDYELKEFSEIVRPFFTDLVSEITRLTGNFLIDSELELCGKIVPPFLTACRSDLEKRKRVKEELLPHIFNANPREIEKFFKKPDARSKMLLTKTEYREGYWSQKLNKFVGFRHWKGVSPLQAAFLCGDVFLGLKLLAYIIKDENLRPYAIERSRLEALLQLQEVLNRIGSKTSVEKANANIPATATVTISIAEAVTNNNIGSHEKVEFRHELVANTENECADSAPYLAPIKALLKAYNTYLTSYHSLSLQNKWNEIDALWEQVGECQKRLPHYVIQEFFTPILFHPLPSFDTEPSRFECQYWYGDLLDLDKLGISTSCAFCKGALGAREPGRLCTWRGGGLAKGGPGGVGQVDSTAINHLCKLREADLRNTIGELQTLESAINLVSNNKSREIFV